MRGGCPGGYRSSDDSHFRLAAASSVTTSFNRSICMNLRMACAGLVGMQGRSVARRRIRCRDAPSIRPWRLGGGIHAATRSRPRTRHHAPSMPSAFLSAPDSNWWCLRECRRGTLSGMDAAPEPTWTYLRRVPHRYACKRPQQTEAFAQSRQTSCARLFCVGTRASACSNPMHSYKTRRCRPKIGGAAPHPVSVGAQAPAANRRPCKKVGTPNTRTASRSHCQPSGLHGPANERCYATAAVLPATTPRSR
ncbi:hypothetical protein FHR64_003183 [Xanthomonas arboricola]|nr:hypothetical protein [Xanthomonas arboricola]